MIYIDLALLNLTESWCRRFQVWTGRTNVWLAVQLTNLSIIVYFVAAGVYFVSSALLPRIALVLFCGGLMYGLTQSVFKEPIETYENNAYRRVAKGLRNPRRVRDVLLRISFLTLSLVLFYPLLLVCRYQPLPVVLLLSYSLIVLTTVILYLLACDPLAPCAGRIRGWLRGSAPSRLPLPEAAGADPMPLVGRCAASWIASCYHTGRRLRHPAALGLASPRCARQGLRAVRADGAHASRIGLIFKSHRHVSSIRPDSKGVAMRCHVAVLGLACVVIQSGAVAAQSGPNREAVQKQILTNERAVIEAIFKNDATTFQSLVVGDSVIVTGEGVVKVAEFGPMMKQTAAECKLSKIQISDSTFYWFNDTTLLHSYKTSMEATCGGEPIKPSWSSSIWVNKGGKWQGSFHQESELVPPPPPTKK